MTNIQAKTTGAELSVQVEGPLTSGMVGVPVLFAFDKVWDGLTKTAVFRAGRVSKDRVNVEGNTTVPWEVLQQENYALEIGVYGCNADGTVVIPTVWADAGLIHPGADPSGDPSTDPVMPVWQQAINASHQALDTAQQVQRMAENGEFDGEKGEKGDPGPQGEKGDPGPAGPQGDPGPSEVFIAEYGVTTHAELEEAYNAGKVLFCRVGNYVVLMHSHIAGESTSFFRVTANERTNYYCTVDGWGNKVAVHKPGAHAASHGADGSDPITPESIGAASAETVGDIETALDNILAIQYELIGFNPNNLYVDGIAYTAEEGMTWGEFIESDYNPQQLNECCGEYQPAFHVGSTVDAADDTYVHYMGHCGPGSAVRYADGSPVDYTDVINLGYDYQTT